MNTLGEEPQISSPWSQRSRIGGISAFLMTVRQILSDPRSFFDSIFNDHRIGDALKFYLLFYVMQFVLAGGFMVIVQPALGAKAVSILGTMLSLKGVLIACIVAVIAIVAIVVTIFTSAFIVHIFVLIFKGNGGFSGTFSVLAYGNTVQFLFLLAIPVIIFFIERLPFISPAIILMGALIYFLIVTVLLIRTFIIGYKEIHSVTTWKAALILIAPCLLLGMLYFVPVKAYRQKIEDKSHLFEKLKTQFPVKQETADAKPAAAAGQIAWKSDFKSALEEAQRTKAPVMADFYATWCGWCKRLDVDTYQDDEVKALAGKFICVKIDGDQSTDVTMKYRVRAYPTILFFNPDGMEEKRIGGYVGPRDMARIMKDVLSSKPVMPEQAPSTVKPDLKPETPGEPKPRFRFEGIVMLKNLYKAIINGAIVEIGDTVAGAKVTAISKNSVTLLDKDGKEIVLNQ